MNYIGHVPDDVSLLAALDSIGENIIIADKNYNISWMNSSATKLLTDVAPLFGFSDIKEIIGINMDRFHRVPQHQQNIMGKLTKNHRARINILDRLITDIVITAIKNNSDETMGYVVMLMDVTTKSEEETRKDTLINSLSVPILNIWKKTIAVPLIGEFDTDRANRLITAVVAECALHQIEFALIDLSGISNYDSVVGQYIQNLNDTLKIIGTECIIVGISPKLAMTMVSLELSIPTFSSAYAGLHYIINNQK
ncbi:STAS domain-containing protein [Sporosarcina sp. ANT_H38]|uniref:STAS domain-containing protein n=1 Tax=Sporosarcina sp. ANT_H38 TaxID=2597358 RepID=UPI0011F19A87|nr:STAS domain-containing protein [Sporosarcina sp. ANT_H38]KAA0942087.1 STAS domain-containing protein [Sporosarcina sp. ANT_H38]